MVAAPQYGTLIFRGQSGRTYVKDVYFSDVANASARFDAGAGAGASSETFVTFKEAVTLVDFSVVTGLTDTTKLRLTQDNVPKGDILRYSIHLTTLNNRPQLVIGFAPGTRISAVQLS